MFYKHILGVYSMKFEKCILTETDNWGNQYFDPKHIILNTCHWKFICNIAPHFASANSFVDYY